MATQTSSMGLYLPTSDPSDGDIWGTSYLNPNFERIDAHRHITGEGNPVPVAGLRIDTDLQLLYGGNYRSITGAKTIAFQPHTQAATAGYIRALYVDSSDNSLYYRTNLGTRVRITNGNNLDIVSSGGFAGDYATLPAEAAYSDANKWYTFRQSPGSSGPWASMETGPVDIHEEGPYFGARRVRLKSPAALAASYALTFPGAVPGSTVLVQVDSSGVMTFSNTLASNASLTLQGTGDLKHGDKTLCQGADGGLLVSGASYSVFESSNAIGHILASAAVVFVPIRGLRDGARLKSITVYGTSGNEPTFLVVTQLQGSATTRAHTGSSTIVGNGFTTLTINTPYTLAGDHVWVKVTAGASAFTINQLATVFDRT